MSNIIFSEIEKIYMRIQVFLNKRESVGGKMFLNVQGKNPLLFPLYFI